ncbi:MAG: histidine--tRNA ligase [Acidilobaceae archaeon]
MSREARPPRGFRDFPPEVMIARREVIGKIVTVFERYGFDPLDTPAIEYWETLAGKYGEEAESRLIWRFTDPWSGREYALRYDLTVPLARFVASRPDIPLPFKRYHIAPVWRHEEPQRGRYREFYQCDADIVGSPYPEADAEILDLTADVLKEVGFSDFKILVNDRRILAGIFESELELSDPLPLYRAIDKLDKIGVEGVRRELLDKGYSREFVETVMKLIEIRGDPFASLDSLCSRYSSNTRIREGCEHLFKALDLVHNADRIVFDLSLVRGLDYYTGPIFEAKLSTPRIGSVAGGGRYDNLIKLFAGRDIPATGVSLGLERIIDASIELGLVSTSKQTLTEAQVVVLDWALSKYAWRVARILREAGVNTRIDLMRSSEDAQRRRARRLGVPVLVFIGQIEAEKGVATVYHAPSGRREVASLEELPRVVKALLAGEKRAE